LDGNRKMSSGVRLWLTRYIKTTRQPSNDCAHCRFREEDRAVLESAIPGLGSFSSGFGASVADSRLCTYQDRLTSPRDRCDAFEGRTVNAVLHLVEKR
jgi:hypothetical protein